MTHNTQRIHHLLRYFVFLIIFFSFSFSTKNARRKVQVPRECEDYRCKLYHFGHSFCHDHSGILRVEGSRDLSPRHLRGIFYHKNAVDVDEARCYLNTSPSSVLEAREESQVSNAASY